MSGAQERAEALRFAYVETFSSPAGLHVLDDVLARAGVLSTSMSATPSGNVDPMVVAYNEGRRALALDILRELEWRDADIVDLSRRLTRRRLADEAQTMTEIEP